MTVNDNKFNLLKERVTDILIGLEIIPTSTKIIYLTAAIQGILEGSEDYIAEKTELEKLKSKLEKMTVIYGVYREI